MAQKEIVAERRVGWFYLGLWAVLIIAGIVNKRAFGNADAMVFFHLPAAVFLVLAFYRLSRRQREHYTQQIRRLIQ